MNISLNKGLSLIEFIVYLVIVSAISSFIITMFYNPSNDAYDSTLNSLANSLTAASASNYRLSRAGSLDAGSISNCSNAPNALTTSNQIPAGYTITPLAVPVGTQVNCTLTAPNGATKNFQTIGTS